MDKKTHLKYIATILIIMCWALNMKLGLTHNNAYTKPKIEVYKKASADDNQRISKTHQNVSIATPNRKDVTDGKRNMAIRKNFSLEAVSKHHTQLKFPFYLREVKTGNCKNMFAGKKEDIFRADSISHYTLPKELNPQDYIQITRNCSSFIRDRGYIIDPLTIEEKNFPLAFSILIYQDLFQFERLLRAIYRPQNYYCIHADRKSTEIFRRAVFAISQCFNNVFIASDLVSVQWGTFSTVIPELSCMKDLLKFKNWKYFINLTGQEFPLRTNYELVRILKAYNGANDIKKDTNGLKEYWHRLAHAGPPPHGLKPVKGSAHIVVNKNFVENIVYNRKAKDVIFWGRNVWIPDETIFSSLNMNPHFGIKGAYTGSNNYDSASRYKIWGPALCFGKFVRQICIFGTRDLPALYKAKEMFVNKIYWNFHHYVLDCLEENIFKRTKEQFLGKISFDDRYYRNLDFVKHHL